MNMGGIMSTNNQAKCFQGVKGKSIEEYTLKELVEGFLTNYIPYNTGEGFVGFKLLNDSDTYVPEKLYPNTLLRLLSIAVK